MKKSKIIFLFVCLLCFTLYVSAQQAKTATPAHVNQTNEQRIAEMNKRNAEIHAHEQQLAPNASKKVNAAASSNSNVKQSEATKMNTNTAPKRVNK